MTTTEPLSALAVVARLESGEFIERLAAALADIGQQVAETGEAGVVSVQITIKPATKTHWSLLEMLARITRRPPKVEPQGTVVYAKDGQFYVKDPQQTEMALPHVVGDEEERAPAWPASADRAPARRIAE